MSVGEQPQKTPKKKKTKPLDQRNYKRQWVRVLTRAIVKGIKENQNYEIEGQPWAKTREKSLVFYYGLPLSVALICCHNQLNEKFPRFELSLEEPLRGSSDVKSRFHPPPVIITVTCSNQAGQGGEFYIPEHFPTDPARGLYFVFNIQGDFHPAKLNELIPRIRGKLTHELTHGTQPKSFFDVKYPWGYRAFADQISFEGPEDFFHYNVHPSERLANACELVAQARATRIKGRSTPVMAVFGKRLRYLYDTCLYRLNYGPHDSAMLTLGIGAAWLAQIRATFPLHKKITVPHALDALNWYLRPAWTRHFVNEALLDLKELPLFDKTPNKLLQLLQEKVQYLKVELKLQGMEDETVDVLLEAITKDYLDYLKKHPLQ